MLQNQEDLRSLSENVQRAKCRQALRLPSYATAAGFAELWEKAGRCMVCFHLQTTTSISHTPSSPCQGPLVVLTDARFVDAR